MKTALFCTLVLLAVLVSSARAWHGGGHKAVAAAVVSSMPPSTPDFFRQGAAFIADTSLEPDLFRDVGGSQLAQREGPDHFLDVEMLQGQPIPETRADFLVLCQNLKIDPVKVGAIPYSVTEWTQRLTVAFAVYRRWPDDRGAQARCLTYAGILAHYAADLHQPLHTTIHYNGRLTSGGESPRTGIHHRSDALIERLGLTPDQIAQGLVPAIRDPLFPSVLQDLQQSHAQVDRVYELESQLPPKQGDWQPSPVVRQFGLERAQAAAKLLADLYLTAWEQSAQIQLPAWFVDQR